MVIISHKHKFITLRAIKQVQLNRKFFSSVLKENLSSKDYIAEV